MKGARSETFLGSLKINMCPKLTFWSFVTMICLIDSVMFSSELIYGGLKPGSVLTTTSQTLDLFGDKNPYKMRYDYQVYRFFTPMLLHSSAYHLISNVIATMIIGA
mmetsp:Transcript_17548/g.24143  ORF Transcript_17548/g.24143 Transcript_17548/m.24143 type:complete len:106 (+) Transcript_17548:128-445(+)